MTNLVFPTKPYNKVRDVYKRQALTGQTPVELLRKARLEKAKKLLQIGRAHV